MVEKTSYSANQLKQNASVVLYVTFIDGNVRTFWSRDVAKEKGNRPFWFLYLKKLVETRKEWTGRVKEWAIYEAYMGQKENLIMKNQIEF